MPLIDVPTVGVIEFPDSMSTQEIEKAIRENILKPQRAPTSLKDIGLSALQGVVGAGKSIADVFGAENVVSQTLGGAQEGLQSYMTPARLAEMQRRRGLEEEAAKTGKWTDEISAFLGGVAEAPVQSLAQAIGSFAPYVGTGLLGGVAKLAPPTIRAVNLAVGLAQGAGEVKGSIYDAVKDTLQKQGMSLEEAKQQAAKAQETLGENFLNIVTGAGLGALGAATGVEKLFTKAGAAAAPEKFFPRVGRAMAEEALPEGAQAGQEQYATNVALQRAGVDVPSMRGVLGASVRDAVLGAMAAGPIAAVRGPTPTPALPPAPTPTAEETPPAAPPTQLELPLEAPEQPPTKPITAFAPSGKEYEPQTLRAESAEARDIKAAQVEDQIRELRNVFDIYQRENNRLEAAYNATEDPQEKVNLRARAQEIAGPLQQLKDQIEALQKQAVGLSRPGSAYAQRQVAQAGQTAFDFGEAPTAPPAAPPTTPTTPPPAAPAAPTTTLTPEAEKLLASVDAGGVPGFLTKNLRKIAADNGVEVTGSSTPNSIIDALRAKKAITEPPKAPNMVRVYHSGSVGGGKDGRWVSTDRTYAENYRPNLPLYYVDIPANDPRVNNPDYPEQGLAAGATFNFELTPQEATALKETPRKVTAPAAPTKKKITQADITRMGIVSPKLRSELMKLDLATPEGYTAFTNLLNTTKAKVNWTEAEKFAASLPRPGGVTEELVAKPEPVTAPEAKRKPKEVPSEPRTETGREAGGEGAGVSVPQQPAGRGVAGTEPRGMGATSWLAPLPAGGKGERAAALRDRIKQAKKTLEITRDKQQYNDALDFLVQHAKPAEITKLAPENDIKEARSRVAQKGVPALRPSAGPVGRPTGNTVEGVKKSVARVMRPDSGFERITTVVQSEGQLPDAVKESPDYQPGVKGVAHRGRVWLVADNIPQGRELGVFLHEAGAHIGFDKALKKGDREFLANQVRNWSRGNDLKARVAKEALEKGGKSNDEVIAYTVEGLVNEGVKPVGLRPEATFLKRILEAFKSALKKLGLMQSINEQDLVDLAFGAAHIAAKTPIEEGLAPGARFAEEIPATITVDGKQRPTTNSNGQLIHPTEEGIRNFWRWFGDSKAVDEKGRPLVGYHGTKKDFAAFDPRTATTNTKHRTANWGFFFSNNPQVAEIFAGKYKDLVSGQVWGTTQPEGMDRLRVALGLKPKNVRPVMLKKAEFEVKFWEGANLMPTFLSIKNPKEISAEEFLQRFTESGSSYSAKSFVEEAKKDGHDGIVIRAGKAKDINWEGTEYSSDAWVAFEPNQIKSATGNVGAFSPTSKDIRFSKGILTDEDRKLFSGAPPAKGIISRAIDSIAGQDLTDTLAGVMQRVRQNMASKTTYWEDFLTAKQGNNARDAVGNLSGHDRVMAATKVPGIQLAVLEHGGFGRSPNGMWGASLDKNGKFRAPKDSDPSVKKMYMIANSMAGKYDGIDTTDDARVALNLAAGARRESELIKEGHIGPNGEITRSLSDDQIERGLRLYNSIPEIREVLKTFEEINAQGLDALVKAGVIDAETAAKYKKAVGYVPWFRFVVDKDGNINVQKLKEFSKGLVNYSAMKDLEGAKIEDIQIDDLLDNVARLSNWMVSKAIGNDTARYMVDVAAKYGQARRVGEFGAKGVDRSRVVQVFRDGKPEYYELADPMAMAAFKGHETAHGAFVGALSVPANVLRKGVTLFPVFPVAQLPQDAVRAFTYSGLKNPYAVFPRIFKNFVKEAFGETETSKILAARGIRGRGAGTAREEIKKHFAKALGTERNLFSRALESLEKWSDASDLAVRTALYELTMEEGGSEEEAIRRARDIINFDIQGASKTSSFLRQTVPFHGVWANDLNNLYKGLILGRGRLSEGDARQVRNTIVYRGMQLAALTALYTLAVGDDDDYKKLDDATRVRSLIIPGSNIRIPVPGDGIGFLFKVIPEEITRYMLANGIESDDAGAKFGKALFKGFESVGSFENFMPTGLRVPVEMALNKTFYTDNPIVGMSKQKLEAHKQFTETTGAIAKEVGAAMGVSPLKLEYLLRGISGQIGGFVYAMTNALFDAVDNKVTPTKKWFEVPGLRAFTYRDADKAVLDDFYEFREQVDKVARTYSDMIKGGRGQEAIAYMSDPQNQKTLALRNIETKMERDLSVFRQQRKLILNNQRLSSDEMRDQLDKLDEAQSRYLRGMQLPKLRAIADVNAKLDLLPLKMLR